MHKESKQMKTLIFGAGNLLLTDEGFGVHCIRHLEANYDFPEEVELYDGGTLGIMVSHKFEEAERIFLLDILDTTGQPGEIRRYEKDEVMLNHLPVKLSPHQIGIQEMLMVCELRGVAPERFTVLGAIPASLDSGDTLTPPLARACAAIGEMVVAELRRDGIDVRPRATAAA